MVTVVFAAKRPAGAAGSNGGGARLFARDLKLRTRRKRRSGRDVAVRLDGLDPNPRQANKRRCTQEVGCSRQAKEYLDLRHRHWTAFIGRELLQHAHCVDERQQRHRVSRLECKE